MFLLNKSLEIGVVTGFELVISANVSGVKCAWITNLLS